MRLTTIVFFLLSLNISGQNLFDKTWSSDLLMRSTDMVSDNQGFSYFTFEGSNAQVDSSVAVVVKTNSDFDIIWSKRYKTYSRDDLARVEILNDGNLLLGGAMRQNFALELGAGLIKIDPDGNVLWRRVIDGNFDRRIIFSSEKSNGEIVLVNRYGVTGQSDAVITISSTGDILSSFDLFEGKTGLSFNEVIQYSDTTYLGTGRILDQNLGRNVVFVALFKENQPVWFRKYDFGQTATGTSLDINAEGDIAVGANILNPESIINGQNSVIFRLNSEGEYQSGVEVSIENDGFNKFSGGLELEDSGEIMGAFTFQTDVGPIPVAAMLDASDNLLWVTVPQTGLEYSHSYFESLNDGRYLYMGRDLDGNILVNTRSSLDGAPGCEEIPTEFDIQSIIPEVFDSNLLFEPANYETFILPIQVTDFSFEEGVLCDINLSSVNVSQLDKDLIVYPNPAENMINYALTINPMQIEIFSVDGSRVPDFSAQLLKGEIDIEALPSGLYLVKFHTSSGQITRRFIKQ